jgi:NADP-dependent 3-hydroxy acid dehydrogenase YdfG
MAARKIAIVTGGNRGIGREIARQLIRNDIFVVVGARTDPKAALAVDDLKKEGANVAGHQLDVNDTKSVKRFLEHLEKHHGKPSILVNNAGVYPEETNSKVEDTPTSVWRETFETNLFGAVRMCRETVPMMKKLRYGRIVNISSGLGQLHQMGEGSPAYRVSKAALNALTRTLAAEVAGQRHPRELDEPGLGQNGHGWGGGAAHGGRGRGHGGVALAAAFQRPHRPVLPRPKAHPLVKRLPRLVLLAAAAVILAACNATGLLYSNIAFAYSNAAPMLTWAVDDYVDLSDGQKDWVRERWTRLLAWHRTRELPEYRRMLAAFESSLDGGLTVDEVRGVHRELRAHYNRVLDQVMPHMADLLLQLDAEQVEGLERKFAEDNVKVVKEAGTDADKRRDRGIRRTMDHLEAWIGSLEASQRELVAARLRALPDIGAERMADRRYRQSQTLALIRAKPEREAMIAGLKRLLVDTQTWRSPDYVRRLQERDTRNFEMLSELSMTLTPEQRAHLHRRVRGYIADINTLVAAR